MKRQILPVSAALLLLALAGCQPKASVVGKWKGKEMTGMAASTPAEKTAKEFADKMIASLQFEFKPDGTATMGLMGFDLKGKYTVAGNQVTMTMEPNAMTSSAPPQPPMVLTLSPDGKTLTMAGQKGAPGQTVLERAP
jgi:hypothetical protein